MASQLRGHARGLLAVAAFLVAFGGPAGTAHAAATPALWDEVAGKPPATRAGNARTVRPDRFSAFRLDHAGMRAALGGGAVQLSLPAPGGAFKRFRVQRDDVMSADFARRYPSIRTFAGRGIDEPWTTVRVDIGPLGFHASVRGARNVWYVEPYYQRDRSTYVSYFARDLPRGANRAFDERDVRDVAAAVAAERAPGEAVTRRTYRLALVSDSTYADYFSADGDSTATADEKVNQAKVTLMSRVNQLYGEDAAVVIQLLTPTPFNLNTPAQTTGANGPCGVNPCFTAAEAAECTQNTIDQNTVVLGQILGATNYDIGHLVLGRDGGGIAYRGVVGSDFKGGGCTGLPEPVGDFFAVDYVAHEMGHQFGGNHTFNGVGLNCGGQRAASASVEPGSGSSVMAYAGICAQDNLQPHSDPYFSQRSIDEIEAYTSTSQPPIGEIQTVSLDGYNAATDSFVLSNGTRSTNPIGGPGGVPYTGATLKAEIQSLVPGSDVAIYKWGDFSAEQFGPPGTAGFMIAFEAPAANLPLLGLEATGATATIRETQKGGATDNLGTTIQTLANRAPVVTAPAPRSIPTRTPFALSGSATDPNGDALVFLWEQNDRGGPLGTALTSNAKANGPLFRQFGTRAVVSDDGAQQSPAPGENQAPADTTRVFPDMAQVMANNTNAESGACPAPPAGGDVPAAVVDCYSEFLPTSAWVGFPAADRTLHFRLTARDRAGGVSHSDTALTVVPTAGPFLVTSQASDQTVLGNSLQTVTWDVAGTSAGPIGASAVRITMSTDGGATFGHVLAASTPNDGTEAVALPNVATTAGRIKVEAVGNVFFDVANANLAIRTISRRNVPASVPYGDTLSPPPTITVPGGGVSGRASGLPAGLSLTESGSGGDQSFAVVGRPLDRVATYPATVTLTGEGGQSSAVPVPIEVTAESASVTYTGARNVRGVARLRARVAETDATRGDLRTALVSFHEGSRTVCGPVPADADGRATCAKRLSSGPHRIRALAGGNYAGRSGPVAVRAAKPPLCAAYVVLTDVVRSGGRVRLAGLADRVYAGKRVTLRENGRRIGRAKVRRSGAFATRVPAPATPASRTTYRARVGKRSSAPLHLERLITISRTVRRSGTTVRGRLDAGNAARRKLVVERRTDCATSPRRVRTLRTDAAGRFSVTVKPPGRGRTAEYRVRTASGKPTSFSLPIVIAR